MRHAVLSRYSDLFSVHTNMCRPILLKLQMWVSGPPLPMPSHHNPSQRLHSFREPRVIPPRHFSLISLPLRPRQLDHDLSQHRSHIFLVQRAGARNGKFPPVGDGTRVQMDCQIEYASIKRRPPPNHLFHCYESYRSLSSLFSSRR